MDTALLHKEIVLPKAVYNVAAVSAFVILTVCGAYIRIPLPFTPVPITLQTFFVLLCAAFLGTRLAVITQLTYLSLGVIGIPVFAGSIGSGLLGPTAGYLYGFVVAVFWIGRLLPTSKDSLLRTLLILYSADILLLTCGLLWLKFMFGGSLGRLLWIGVIPFLPGDAIKAFAAAVVYHVCKPRLRRS